MENIELTINLNGLQQMPLPEDICVTSSRPDPAGGAQARGFRLAEAGTVQQRRSSTDPVSSGTGRQWQQRQQQPQRRREVSRHSCSRSPRSPETSSIEDQEQGQRDQDHWDWDKRQRRGQLRK